MLGGVKGGWNTTRKAASLTSRILCAVDRRLTDKVVRTGIRLRRNRLDDPVCGLCYSVLKETEMCRLQRVSEPLRSLD